MITELDEDSPLWCINEQIKGLLEGLGADEDHQDVLKFLRSTGLPEDTVARLHRAMVCAEVEDRPDVFVEHQLFMDGVSKIIDKTLPVGTGLKVLKMNLISCRNCGVVLDKDKLAFNDDFYDNNYIVDDKLATWNTETDNGFTPYVPCPVCKEKVLK